jgi:putative ABC transport system ATP-binding protein
MEINMESLIMRTENVTRRFKSGSEIIYALKDVTVSIPRNKLTIFRGRSGSGKTTLLNMLSGLDKPSEGKVFLGDTDITSLPDKEMDKIRAKKIGFVFQSIALMPDMNALENVEYGLRISGKLRKKTDMSAMQCLEMVGLGKRAKHLAAELSGGEQQRVAIARSFAHGPEIIFADEPTAELDTAMGIQVVDIFKRLISEHGITVVMTTHDPHMLELADCVYTLSDGVIVDGND